MVSCKLMNQNLPVETSLRSFGIVFKPLRRQHISVVGLKELMHVSKGV